jgi:hypothetical protein
MAVLIWIGAALALRGVGGLGWSAVIVVRARRAGLDEAGLRARMARALPINLGALLLSVLGLMCVVTGVLLG